MARRGPKGNSPDQQKAKGETRPSRVVEIIYADHESRPDPDYFEPPVWLSDDAKELWFAKIERYRKRGQKIDGFEDALAQYVVLEAQLIKNHMHSIPTPMSMVSAHRIWAAEFYDTPASMKVSPSGGTGKKNRFTDRGRRENS